MTTTVARAERIILNPAEVAAPGFPEIDLNDGAIRVTEDGPDWGEQEVKQFTAEGLFGSRPIDSVWPPRIVTIPLVLGLTGGYDAARLALQAAVGQINDEGGWLKREMIGGDYGEAGKELFCDIVKASLKLGHGTPQVINALDPNAELVLECLSDFYGPVTTGEVHEGTGDLAFTEQIGGDMPARVEEMRVEDLSGNDQKGLMWHYRRRNYSSATTASWAYDAEALGLLDIAEKVASPGGAAYGAKVVKHPNLSTEWTPVLSTNIGGTQFLTHTGLYTVWARVYSTSATLPWLRLVYGVGDVVAPQENVQVQVPGVAGWYWVPLGQVNIRALPFGAQRWEGVIQARAEGTGSSEAIYIDRLRLLCADECSGVLGALPSTTALASIVASDPLVGEGALNGSEAVRGGKWEELPEGGGGFTRSAEGAKREAKEDSGGRTAVLAGSTVGPVRVRCEVSYSKAAEGLAQEVYLRYFSPTSWVRVGFVGLGYNGKRRRLRLEYDVGAGPVVVELANLGWVVEGATLDVNAEIDAGAGVTVRLNGNVYRATLPATFKKGEAHAEGKVGIYDYNPSSTATTRTYLHFTASPLPPSDAVIYANRAAHLSTLGMYRDSADGEGVGPIGRPGADLPRLPVSGPEGMPVEIAVAPSRGQFGELADSGKDPFKVQLVYRECFAEIPEN